MACWTITKGERRAMVRTPWFVHDIPFEQTAGARHAQVMTEPFYMGRSS
jgi:hypothetical protein